MNANIFHKTKDYIKAQTYKGCKNPVCKNRRTSGHWQGLQIKDQIIEQVSFGGFLVFVIVSVLICILLSRQAGHYLLEFSRLIK